MPLFFVLQSGEYDLIGTIVYEIDHNPYQSTFYNGTIEVTEVGGLLSVESVFLFCLAVALLGLLGIWIRGQIQNFSKVIILSGFCSCTPFALLPNLPSAIHFLNVSLKFWTMYIKDHYITAIFRSIINN